MRLKFSFNLLVIFTFSLALQAAPTPPKAVIVQTEKLKDVQLFTQLSYPARIAPKINATVLSETEGVVTEIPSPLGTAVEKNTRLIVVKNTDPIYHYAPFSVVSPVKGAVSSLDVSIGSRISRGQRLATITDPSQVLITVEVAASDLFSIQKGLAGELRIPGRAETVPLKVRGISPFVDPGTGTATAELVLTENTSKFPLPPGSLGQVLFRTDEHKGIQVPESAIVYKGKDPHVRVIDGKKAKYVPVTPGVTRQGMVEILKGIDSSAEVIIRASQYVGDGEEVVVEDKKG